MLKAFPAQLATLIRSRRGIRNLRVLGRFFFALGVMIVFFSIGFHLLMLREGQEHTWITGFYWTLTVMSTLGFGDITFHTDLGRMFSIVVLATRAAVSTRRRFQLSGSSRSPTTVFTPRSCNRKASSNSGVNSA